MALSDHRFTTLAATLAAGCLIALAVHTPIIADEPPPPGESEAADDAEAKAAERLERTLEARWWNRDRIVEAAKLTDEQRHRLDEMFREAYLRRNTLELEQRDSLPAFGESLMSGDRAAQTEVAEGTARRMDELARVRMQLMIDGVAVLTDAQRKLLAADFPHVFNRPWLGFYGGVRPAPRGAQFSQRDPDKPRPGRGGAKDAGPGGG